MTSCFPFVRRKQRNNKEIYLVILGLDNAGKTTTTRSIKGVSSDLVAPTIGFDRIEFAVDRFNINLYDLGGGRTIRDIWQTYFAEVHGVIFVVDSSAPERLEECQTVLTKLFAHPSISGKPVLLLANKQDVEEAMDEADLIHALQLDYLANEYRCPCRLERCCALLRPGKKLDKAIRTGLRWLLAYIESEWDTLGKRIHNDMAQQAREQALEREARRERVRLAREKRERLERERNQVESSVETIHENGATGMECGDVSLVKNRDSLVQVVAEDHNPVRPRTPRQITVIDLENKVGPVTPAPNGTPPQLIIQPKQQQSSSEQHSLDFSTAPEPILVRESTFTPKASTRLSLPHTTTARSLMNSHELRRQIQIACSIDLDPSVACKSTLDGTRESMKIEELDEADDRVQSAKISHQIGVPASEQTVEKLTNKPTPPTNRRESTNSTEVEIVRSCSASNPFDDTVDPLEIAEPRTTQTSLESVKASPTKLYKPKTGLAPPMVDALYNLVKKQQQSMNGTDRTLHQQGDRPFSFLIVSSKDKRPSPITRIFTPSINKLHPKRRFSDTDGVVQNGERQERTE